MGIAHLHLALVASIGILGLAQIGLNTAVLARCSRSQTSADHTPPSILWVPVGRYAPSGVLVEWGLGLAVHSACL